MEVEAVDCDDLISVSAMPGDLSKFKTSGGTPFEFDDTYAGTDSAVACPMTFSLSSNDDISGWISISTAGVLSVDTDTLGEATITVDITSINSYSKSTDPFIVKVICTELSKKNI